MLFFSEVPDPQPVAESPPAIVVKAVPDPQPCAAPVVAARTFRNGDYHAGHQCPTCGRTVKGNIVSGIHDVYPHYHRCPYDGTAWHH